MKENVNWDKVQKLALINKTDLTEEVKVTEEMISKFTEDTGIEVMKVSAKAGTNVHEAFAKISE